MPNPANAARVEVSINVTVSNGIATIKSAAALDFLLGIDINIPTASAAMS